MKRNQILSALRCLGNKAKAAGIRLEVSIYGGTAFLLAYNSREGTKDIDAILKPREVGQQLVEAVASELSLPEDWLNSNVAQFISPLAETKRRLANIEDQTGLIIHVPTARYLLAMKTLACRRPIGAYQGDVEDLRFLIHKMQIQSLDEIQEAVDAYYPDEVIQAKNISLLQSLIDSQDE
jgi:hypothetical protein